ncbi:DUF4345 domain-containing protein [Nocardia stercoris]|nr:DUF4345 domain-containing protein [Nocardia stercoris]
MRVFRGWLVLFGVVMIAIAVAHLLFGQATYIGGGAVNSTMDSDLRFFNVLFLAYGLAFVWAARDIPGRGRVVDLLGLLFFAGGVVRLLAWAVSGAPSWFYVVMIPVELIVPVLNYGWPRALARGSS